MDTIQLKSGKTIEVMDYEEWEAYHESNIGCLASRWQFENNCDGDLEDYTMHLYEEYVDKIRVHFEKEGA